MSGSPTRFPASIESKLRSVRLRHAAMAAWRALAAGFAALMALMLVAMAVDWMMPFLESSVRVTMTSAALAAAAGLLLWWAVGPVKRALGWDQAADAVDDDVPQLQQRWSTVASLSQRDSASQTPVEQAMARQVTSEAIAMERVVKPAHVAPPVSPKRSMLAVVAGVFTVVGLYAISPGQVSVLLQRFWSPHSTVTSTQVSSLTGDQLIPRGEKVELAAKLAGVLRSRAELTVRHDDGEEEVFKLRAQSEAPDQFTHAMRVDDGLTYRVRSGDGQTPWHRLDVIDYPDVAEMQLEVVFPAYTGRESVLRDRLPRRLKVIQGSQLSLAIKPREPVDSLTVSLTPPKASRDAEAVEPLVEKVAVADDGWHRFQIQLVDDILLESSLLSPHGLKNEQPLFSRIDVITDKAPVARIVAPTDETAASIDETIEIEFEAHDDIAIAKAELVVYDETRKDENGNPIVAQVMEIPLGDQAMQKHVKGTATLDLKSLNLPEGSEISYAVRVTDNREIPAEASPMDSSNELLANADKVSGGDQQRDNEGGNTPNADAKSVADGSESTASSDPSDGNNLARNMLQANIGDTDREGAGPAAAPAKAGSSADEPQSSNDGKSNNGDKTETEGDMIASAKPSAAGEQARPGEDTAGDKSPSNESRSSTEVAKGDKAASSTDQKKPASQQTANNRDSTKNAKEDGVPRESMENRAPANASKSSPQNDRSSKPSPQQNASNTRQPDSSPDNAEPPVEMRIAASDAEPETGTQSKPNSDGQTSTDSDAPGEPSKTKPESAPRKKQQFTAQANTSSQQNTMTKRRKLRITERLAAIAKADDREAKTGQVREKVVEIDKMLEEVEAGLRQVVERTIADADREEQFRRLDGGLESIESYVAELRAETRETQFAFVGLQMVDLTRTHITPARDRVFAALNRPMASQSDATESLKHIVRARELLAALLKRYDRVKREREFKKSLDDAVEMYEIYVEKQRMLLREAQQNRNPLERKMAIVEVDQEYLDRRAEVIELRRQMLDEFAEMMSDDPRLLSRFLELSRRRSRSLRDQLSEIAERQFELGDETQGWLQIDLGQRPDLWTIVVELRLNSADDVAELAADMAERIAKQMPLELDPSVGTAAELLDLSKHVASMSRTLSFDAEELLDPQRDRQVDQAARAHIRQLTSDLQRLTATLDRLLVEAGRDEAIPLYVQPRLLEVRAVLDQADRWESLNESLRSTSYAGVVGIEQQRLATESELLRVELLTMRSGLENEFERLLEEPLPVEIAAMIEQLHKLMESIAFNQLAASWRARSDQLDSAARQQQLAGERLEQAEALFDRIRREVANRLDEAEPQDPNIADLNDPTLDEFLAQLEREPNIAAQLGIPARPSNLRTITDSITWGGEAVSMLGDSGEAAQERAEAAMAMKERKEETGGKPEENRPPNAEEESQKEQAEAVQRMLEQSLVEIEKQQDDPDLTDEQRQQLEKLAASVKELMDEGQSNNNGRRLWRQMVESDEARAMLAGIASGQAVADADQWNKLLSKLDDGLWQVRGKEPPEAYRKAIEQYQDQIRQLTTPISE